MANNEEYILGSGNSSASQKSRLIYIDPNDLASFSGYTDNTSLKDNVYWRPEDLSIAVDLRVIVPDRGDAMRTDYDSEIYNITLTNQKKTGTDWISFFQGRQLKESEPMTFLTDEYTNMSYTEIKNGTISDKESLGIESIDITFDSHFYPQVSIKFIDVHGYSLLNPAEEAQSEEGKKKGYKNFFKALFKYPYPRFLLTVKGQFGSKVTFTLAVNEFKTNFNSQTGNFEVTVTFIGYMYGVYTDIPVNMLIAAPYYDADKNQSTLVTETRRDDNGYKVHDDEGNDITVEKNVKGPGSYWNSCIDNGKFVTKEGKPLRTFIDFINDYNELDKKIDENRDGIVESYQAHATQETNSKKIASLRKLKTQFIDLVNGISNGNLIIGRGQYYNTATKSQGKVPFDEESALGSEKLLFFFPKDRDGGISLNPEKFKDVYDACVKTITVINDGTYGGEFILPNDNENMTFGSTIKTMDVYMGDEDTNKKREYFKETLGRFCRDNNIDRIPTNVGYYYFIYEYNDYYKKIDDSISRLEQSNDELDEEAIQEEEDMCDKILGYRPTIENIFRMIFAHVDTFMHFFDSVIMKKVGKENRRIADYGISVSDTDLSKKKSMKYLPPFPAIYKTDKGKRTLVYPPLMRGADGNTGVFNRENMAEIEFIERMLQAIVQLHEEVHIPENKIEGTANDDGNTDMPLTFYPVSDTDIYYYLNGHKPYDGVSFSKNKNSNYGTLLYMMLRIYNKCRNYNSQDGETDIPNKTTNLEYANYVASHGEIGGELATEIVNEFERGDNGTKIYEFIKNNKGGFIFDNGPEGQSFIKITSKSDKSDGKYNLSFDKGDILYYHNYFEGYDKSTSDKCRYILSPTTKPLKKINAGLTSYQGEGIFNIWSEIDDAEDFYNLITLKKKIDDKLGAETDERIKNDTEGLNNYIFNEFDVSNENFAKAVETYDLFGGSYDYPMHAYLKHICIEDNINGNYKYTWCDIHDYHNIESKCSDEIKLLTEDYNSYITDAITGNKDINNYELSSLGYYTAGGVFKPLYSKYGTSTWKKIFYNENRNVEKNEEEQMASEFLFFISSLPLYDDEYIEKMDVECKTLNVLPLGTAIYIGGLIYAFEYSVKHKGSNTYPHILEGWFKYGELSSEDKSLFDDYDSYLNANGDFKGIPLYGINKNNILFVNPSSPYNPEILNIIRNEYKAKMLKNLFLKYLDKYKGMNIGEYLHSPMSTDGINLQYDNNEYYYKIQTGQKVNVNKHNVLINVITINSPLDNFAKNIYLSRAIMTSFSSVLNKENMDLRIDSLLERIQATSDVYKENNSDTGNDEFAKMLTPETKLALYCSLKILYDKWLSGYKSDRFMLPTPEERKSYINTKYKSNNKEECKKEFNNFLFVDSFYTDISNDFYVDLKTVFNALKDHIDANLNYSVYELMADITQSNKLLLLSLPVYNNIYDPDSVAGMFKPQNIYSPNYSGGTGIGNTYLVMYTHELSHQLDDDDEYSFESDGFNLTDTDPLNLFSLSNNDNQADILVPSFAVTFGRQNQGYFKNISVNMDNPRETDYSIANTFQLANVGNDGSSGAPNVLGQDMFSIYSNRSFNCSVEMMGCANIMPMMYFQLNNIPMFRGAYIITNVEHHIQAGNMSTTFTGTRVSKNLIPFAKHLFNVKLFADGIKHATASGSGTNVSRYDGTVDDFSGYIKDNTLTLELYRTKFGTYNESGKAYNVAYGYITIGNAKICNTIENKNERPDYITYSDNGENTANVVQCANKSWENYNGKANEYCKKQLEKTKNNWANMPCVSSNESGTNVLIKPGSKMAFCNNGCIIVSNSNGFNLEASEEKWAQLLNILASASEKGIKVKIKVHKDGEAYNGNLNDYVPCGVKPTDGNTYSSSSDSDSENVRGSKIIKALEDIGLTEKQAIGAVASIYGESGWLSNGPWKGRKDYETGPYCADGGWTYGICAWHTEGGCDESTRWNPKKINNGDNFYYLFKYCGENKLDPKSLDGQIKYLCYSLTEGIEQSAFEKIKNATNEEDACVAWTKYYERCGGDRVQVGKTRWAENGSIALAASKIIKTN